MANNKNKKKTVLKAKAGFDIATYGVTKPTVDGGVSSSSFAGETIDWSQVDMGKSALENIMNSGDDHRARLKKARDKNPDNNTEEEIEVTVPAEEVKVEEAVEETTTEEAPEVEEVKAEEVVEEEKDTSYEAEDKEVKNEVVDKKKDNLKDSDVNQDYARSLNDPFDNAKVDKGSQKKINEAYTGKNSNPKLIPGEDVNGNTNRQLGGGDFKSFKQKQEFKGGKFSGYQSKGRDSKGNKWDYSFEVTKGGYIKFDKSFAEMGSGVNRVMHELGFRKNKGRFEKAEWNNFVKKYDTALRAAIAKRDKAIKGGKVKVSDFSNFERSILQMNARGFFRGGTKEDTPTQFRSPVKNIEQPTPVFQFRSPFARRDTSYKNKRKNWVPQQSAPMNYGSPFHQEQSQNIQEQQFSSIWEKVQAYGKDMPEKIDKFIKHVRYDPEVDLPINSFQNQEWVGVVTKWLQGQKAGMVKARNSKNNDDQQKIAASVNTLIQDITTYSGKFDDWIARNSGDEAEGNAGGSVVSEGSKKDERFIGNVTFMGDVNTVIAIGEDGKLGIKSHGLPDVKFVEELDNDVFAKDDAGFLQFTKISEELQKSAETGKPLNENVVKGNADQLLRNKDSVLSWAFDPLYGQSWLQDYAQGNPNANLDVFMPESPDFDVDLLTDELHGWLTSKLTESYNQNVPEQPEQKGDAAQGIMNETLAGVEQEKTNKEGVYAEGGEQPPQGPPQQESPMGYKRSPIELLRKYSK